VFERSGGIESLSRMPGCELAEGAPDVRGWEVTSPTFEPVGVVRDLHVDVALRCVRYLEVEVAGGAQDGRRVLLPIGLARIDDVFDRVVVAAPSCLDGVPDVRDVSGRLRREFEREVLDALGVVPGDGEFYDCPAFAEGPFLAARLARLSRRATDRAADPVHEEALVEDSAGLRLRVVDRAHD
jgi:photosynthetic reaction center H subunit